MTLSTALLCRAAAGPDRHALPCLAAVPLSEDHKPNRIDERQRIESAGGVVVWAGTWRVGGVLAVSRAFGDRLLKRYVVAMPDITEQVRAASQLVPGSWPLLKTSSEHGGFSQWDSKRACKHAVWLEASAMKGLCLVGAGISSWAALRIGKH